MRRLTDTVRLLADHAWKLGHRLLSTDLHDAARAEEERRQNKTDEGERDGD